MPHAPAAHPTERTELDPALTRTYWASAAPLDDAGKAWWVTIWLDIGGLRAAVADVHPITLAPAKTMPSADHDAAIHDAGYRRASAWQPNPGPHAGYVAWVVPGRDSSR